MSKHIMGSILPDCEIFKKDLHEGGCWNIFKSHSVPCHCHLAKDGVQPLWFYWIDPVLAIKRYITKSNMLENCTLLMNLNFQTRLQANLPLQEPIQDWSFKQRSLLLRIHALCYLCFMLMPPLLAKTRPIIQYTVSVEFWLLRLFALFWLFCLYSFAVCLLNLHEDEQSKPATWIPVGWIPIYDEKRDSISKPGGN